MVPGEVLRRAGLYHAAYGTAGYSPAMVSSGQRSKIVAIIGADAERIVYRYCSCDRTAVWPQIGEVAPVRFHNRFTGVTKAVGEADLRDFCELTCANAVEIAKDDRDFVERDGDHLGRLFRHWSPFLSSSARLAAEQAFPIR